MEIGKNKLPNILKLHFNFKFLEFNFEYNLLYSTNKQTSNNSKNNPYWRFIFYRKN